MSHQDKKSPQIQLESSASKTNTQSLRLAIVWLLSAKDFKKFSFRKGTTWKPLMLATAALFWVISDQKSLNDRFLQARKISKRIFNRQPEPGKRYQGFIKALKNWHEDLVIIVVGILRIKMQLEREFEYRVVGFVLFAVDGSRIEVPRTKSNKKSFSPIRKKKNTAMKKKEKNESQQHERKQRNNRLLP